jgi:hypothetical protein
LQQIPDQVEEDKAELFEVPSYEQPEEMSEIEEKPSAFGFIS